MNAYVSTIRHRVLAPGEQILVVYAQDGVEAWARALEGKGPGWWLFRQDLVATDVAAPGVVE